MRLGQTVAVQFLTKFGSSILGFLATVYFARTLGAEVLGIYFLADAVVSWLLLGSKMGLSTALFKRLSEGEDKDSYVSAGVILNISVYFLLAVGVYLFRTPLNEYIGAPVYEFVLLMLGVSVLNGFIGSVMKGENLVHLQGVQYFLGTLFRSIFQIALVYLGYRLTGMLIGYVASTAVAALIGIVFLLRYLDRDIDLVAPDKEHFMSIFDYAKYSWIGKLGSQTYSWMDVAILGIFAPSNLVGIYGVCWTLSSVMSLFNNALINTVFPEISSVSAKEGKQRAANYIEDSLAYAGMFTIPGLVGAAVVGEGVLNLYNDEFSQGYLILVILVLAVLLYSYQQQLLNALNAVDRPDLSFRVNAIFIPANIVLNFVLIYLYGWVGAALATLASCVIALLLSYMILSRILNFTLPLRRILNQVSAAVLMGVLVYLLTVVYGVYGINAESIIPTLVSVFFGVAVYFFSLLRLSEDFQKVIKENSPFAHP